jgi:hypothetical protein
VAIDSMVPRRRGARRVSRSVGRTPEHRDATYRQRRAEHEARERRRRRREVPTYADVVLDLLVSFGVGAGFGYLAWAAWAASPETAPAVVCAVLASMFGCSGLLTVGSLLLRRHPAQVRVRERCSVCGRLLMPGRRARRHLRRERRATRGPARSVPVRVR